MKHGRKQPLRSEVRELLMSILRDTSASATARASAGRTLLETEGEGDRDMKAPGEMSAEEIDAELNSETKKGR